MAKNTSIALGDHFTSFIDSQVQAGRYSSASEVVRSALRLLEEHETKESALREALIEGERSGTAMPLDFEAFIERKEREFTKRSKQ
jgi:antitoxin ParD1/3/4